MRESDESLIHRKAKEIEGTYSISTTWGEMVVKLEAIPNYAGGKGCPDEIMCIRVEFPAFGTNVTLTTPVLIEGEKSGSNAAKLDLRKFCERSITGEQRSYVKIPIIVIGGDRYKRLRPTTKQILVQFNPTQVPKRVIE